MNENLADYNSDKPSPESQNEVRKKVPELLLTENNLPNRNTVRSRWVMLVLLLYKFITYFIIKVAYFLIPAKRNSLPAINDPILLFSASELSKRIKDGNLKCEEVVKAYIRRIKQVNPKLNAIIESCYTKAIDRGIEIDEQLQNPKLAEELKKMPLLGVPFTCQDSISIEGLALTAGVKIRKGIKADQDAPVISNLRQAGLIPLSLTNSSELGLFNWDSYNKLYGRTNNPYDLRRIAGGSSGGEGALISAAGSLLGVGSDITGSIRNPSMFNGVFGHKTTKKYVPIEGMFPQIPEICQSFMCFGPICRYASDLPLMLRSMGGSLTDELRLDEPIDFKKIKIYYMEDDGGNPLASFVDKRILNSIQKAIKHFKDEYGVQVEKINIKKFKHSLAFFMTACAKSELKIEDYVTQDGKLDICMEFLKSLCRISNFTVPVLLQILNQYSICGNSNSKIYASLNKMFEVLKPKVYEMLDDNSVMILPTWPTVSPNHETSLLRIFDASYASIMNALEIPATHCPMGLTKEEGLPLGFSVASGPGKDRLTIAFAKEIERKFGGWVAPIGSEK